MPLFKRSITDLGSEVEAVIKQKYGSDTIISGFMLSEGVNDKHVYYTGLIQQPGKDTLVVLVAVNQNQRGYHFQVFEHVHQAVLPH